jgi:predicted transcriptional regulator
MEKEKFSGLLLLECGYNRREVKCLLYLLENEPTYAKRIEEHTGMSKSDVSIGMNILSIRGIVKKVKPKVNCTVGKGRPTKIYQLRESEIIRKILKDAVKEKIQRLNKQMEEIDKFFS